MERIAFQDTVQEAVIKLGDGNPGALTVLIGLAKREDGMADILFLDAANLYGSDIWLAYKDACGEDLDVLSDRLRGDPEGLKMAVRNARGDAAA